MNLCTIYNITDVLTAFGYQDRVEGPKAQALTEEEREVLNAYRNLPQMQPAVKKLLGIEEKKES